MVAPATVEVTRDGSLEGLSLPTYSNRNARQDAVLHQRITNFLDSAASLGERVLEPSQLTQAQREELQVILSHPQFEYDLRADLSYKDGIIGRESKAALRALNGGARQRTPGAAPDSIDLTAIADYLPEGYEFNRVVAADADPETGFNWRDPDDFAVKDETYGGRPRSSNPILDRRYAREFRNIAPREQMRRVGSVFDKLVYYGSRDEVPAGQAISDEDWELFQTYRRARQLMNNANAEFGSFMAGFNGYYENYPAVQMANRFAEIARGSARRVEEAYKRQTTFSPGGNQKQKWRDRAREVGLSN